jgi:putative transcriptional regulator
VSATLLVASPQMKDPYFERTVVLVWHHDADGAIGVVVNKPLPHRFADLIEIPTAADHADAQVAWGGPVEAGSGTVIAIGAVEEDEGWSLDGDLVVTRAQQALMRLTRQRAPLILCLGYAGWGAGQLDAEIASGSWILADISEEILFRVAPEARYDHALASLGLTAQSVWMTPADA